MSTMGRPSKITPELTKRIVDAISRSIPYELAADANDICIRTLYSWLEQGAKDKTAGIESEYRNFLHAVKNTELKKIDKLRTSIEDQSERWQAAAWMLERRWRKYFGADAGIIQELKDTLDDLKAAQAKSST